MSDLKTQPTDQDVRAFLDVLEPQTRRADCWEVHDLMARLTGSPARMWGSSIVGFGTYTYVNSKGKSNDWMLTGFSPRKANLTLYIMSGFSDEQALMAGLGKYKTGVSCLYIKSLDDIERDILEQLIVRSIAYMREKYPTT